MSGRRLWIGGLCLLACALSFVIFNTVRAQEPLRVSLADATESKPIQILADEVIHWREGPERAMLLRGKVWIEQGLTSLRLTEGIVWFNEDEQKKTGVYLLDIYGEGATLESARGRQTAARVQLKLATRGKIPVKSYAAKMRETNRSADPLYVRALALRNAPAGAVTTTTTLPRPVELQTVSVTKTNAPPPPAVNPFEAPKDSLLSPTSALPPTSAPPPRAPALFTAPSEILPASDKVGLPGFPGETTDAGGLPVSAKDLGASPIATSLAQVPFEEPPPAGNQAPNLPPTFTPPTEQVPQVPPEMLPRPAPVDGPTRQLNIRPRGVQEMQAIKKVLPNGETAVIVPTGVIITVSSPRDKKILIDIEADRVVFWTRGGASADPFGNMKTPDGEHSKQMEFYLSGNVEIRNQTNKESQVLRAQEVYYDVGRNVAIALKGDLEIRSPKTIFPIHFKAEELVQLGPKVFEGRRTEAFSTILPSDPGLKIEVREARIEELDTPRTNIFGKQFYDLETGELKTSPQRILTGKGAVLRLEGVPIFYLPYFRTDAEDPLGPLDAVGFNYSRIFGFQVLTTWNIFDFFGIAPQPGLRWQLMADYMSERGPALGTEFRAAGRDLFGFQNRYEGLVKAYGIYDTGEDVLGGSRGTLAFTGPNTAIPITHPDWRGRALAKLNMFEMPGGFTFQGQVSAISDRNFLEQFFNQEWNRDLNQETFAYVRQQQDHWAWSVLGEARIRDWITETEWLPKLEGNLTGLKFFDLFTYNLRSSAGYARLLPADTIPPPYLPTDVRTDTGRFDVIQDVSLPFTLGAIKLAPYAVLDLAYYTQDLTGNDRGRIYGGGGLRANMPLSKLYADIQSDLFNLNGIYHKIMFSGNYYNAQSSAHISQLPQLDRLNDDASDQALRDIFPRQSTLNPANAAFLTTSPLFDPQYYALRRLIDNRVDTLDTIDVLQLGIRQRWQTKRGFPGNEHVVDWMTLDLQGSVFPHSNRDNFGELFGILQYDWSWNIGDRTSLVSNGWFETIGGGPRVFNVGTIINRPDRSNLYLGYRHIDPLNSKAVVASLTYPFSAKYAVTASTVYDFGVHNQTNSFMVSRIGTDLRVSFGVSYNSILNNFGVMLEIVPNLLPGASRFSNPGVLGVPGAPGGGGFRS